MKQTWLEMRIETLKEGLVKIEKEIREDFKIVAQRALSASTSSYITSEDNWSEVGFLNRDLKKKNHLRALLGELTLIQQSIDIEKKQH